MKKQLVSVLLATVLVVTAITGCGKIKGEESQSTQEVQESSAQTSVAEGSSEVVQEIENFNAEGYPIVNEEITLDILLKINNTDSFMDFNEMAGFKMLEEMTGIKVKIETVKQADWATRLSLIMASGDYPDVIWAGGVSQVDWEKYGVDEGILRPWDDLIEAYMPLYQERVSMDPEDRLVPLVASDGHMYALADTSTGVTPQSDNFYFINQDWLEALKLDMPTDIESLTEVLRAFATKDPNGNGEKDEVAITMGKSGLQSFAQLYGVPKYSRWIYIDDNGKVQLVPKNETFKEYMGWMHMLYEEKILDQEVFTQDTNARNAKMAEGIVGFANGYSNIGQGWGLSEESMTLYVPGEETVMHYNPDLAKPGAYITVTNPYPEATARWFDTMLQEEVCLTMNSGNDWKYNAEGKIEISNNVIKENSPYLKGLAFEYWPRGYYAEHFVMSDSVALRAGYGNAYEEAGVYQKYSDYYMDACKFSGEVNERRVQIETDIKSTMTEYVAEFVMNGVTDEKYNEMLGKLKSIGADEYVEMYQVAFDALGIVIE